MTDAAGSNAPELSVTELSSALKRTIEDRFGFVRVRGEITGYRGPHSSGHAYFALKDQGAKIDAVIWKGVFGRMKVRPEEGLEVIATGKITTFPGSSKYQIVIEAIEPAGVGALLAQLEQRRAKLAAEGLFDEARKQLLPFLPQVIGVVTSPTGAVIRDILHRIADRFPRHVLVWPVRVQGETCAAEVAAAINGFNALPEGGPIPRPDLLIVARGGGSLEDLWGFNEEVVVRAAAGSMIPLISAIGHETDWTLIDHAADLRAPTPTGAAEKAVPVRSELLGQVADLARRQQGAALRLVERRRNELRALARALPGAEELVAVPRQRLDRASERLAGALRGGHDAHRLALAKLSQRLANQSPQAKLQRARLTLDSLEARMRRALTVAADKRHQRLETVARGLTSALTSRARIARETEQGKAQRLNSVHQRMTRAVQAGLERRTAKLNAISQLLNSLSYKQVLARGYAVVRDAQGHPLRLAAQVTSGDRLDIQFADGNIAAQAGTGSAPPDPRRPAAKAKPAGPGQGSLF